MYLSLLPFQPSVLIINVFFSFYSATKRVFGCSWPQQIKRWLMHASCSLIFTKNIGKDLTPVLTHFTCSLRGHPSKQTHPCLWTASQTRVVSPLPGCPRISEILREKKTISKLGGFVLFCFVLIIVLSYCLKWSTVLVKLTQIDCCSCQTCIMFFSVWLHFAWFGGMLWYTPILI